MVVTPAPAQVQVSVKLTRGIAWFTRLAAFVAVGTQTILLGLALALAAQQHTPMTTAAERHGGIFAATLVLAGAVFWLTASRPSPVISPTRIGA